MYCIKCGLHLRDSANFCPRCGQKVIKETGDNMPNSEEGNGENKRICATEDPERDNPDSAVQITDIAHGAVGERSIEDGHETRNEIGEELLQIGNVPPLKEESFKNAAENNHANQMDESAGYSITAQQVEKETGASETESKAMDDTTMWWHNIQPSAVSQEEGGSEKINELQSKKVEAANEMGLGLIYILIGIGLTALFYFLARGIGATHFKVPTGLMIFGLIAVVRGIMNMVGALFKKEQAERDIKNSKE